ncbi:MAG TPA: GNAT family N-acetyltransferase [Paracoccaceae bacterium]|nr:GNAT family N-acetyltransferase [Paracoccaceae bacterium]
MTDIRPAGPGTDWEALLALIRSAFAHMDGIVDPPSSVHRLTLADLRAAAAEPLGCALCSVRAPILYLGKLAVRPDRQGRGIGRALVAAAEAEARARGLAALELQTRIELAANHAAFARLGFVGVGETAHPGYARPTSLTFRKPLEEARP